MVSGSEIRFRCLVTIEVWNSMLFHSAVRIPPTGLGLQGLDTSGRGHHGEESGLTKLGRRTHEAS